jgi:predicted ABC-type ATPase
MVQVNQLTLNQCYPILLMESLHSIESTLQKEGLSSEQISARSTQMMEDLLVVKMDEAIQAKQHFVLETPLSHPDYWRYIDRFDDAGYQIQLNYLCLDKSRTVSKG